MKKPLRVDHHTVTVSRAGLTNLAILTIGTVIVTLVIHGTFVFQILQRRPIVPDQANYESVAPFIGTPTSVHDSYRKLAPRIPELFVFRRTKKTGSSSMLTALLQQLEPYGYHALYYNRGEEMDAVVRNEFLRPSPRRLLIAEHNQVTKAFHPERSVVIADTIRNGYEQMTSYCRYVRNIRTCDSALESCLNSSDALMQINYRWGNRSEEDEDTYIDLPLSSAHPALSTTIMRTVFPNVTLDISRFNVRDSACPEVAQLRNIYNELYGGLRHQVKKLKKRMLVIAGYPYYADPNFAKNISLDRMLDEADRIERTKYELSKVSKTIEYSDPHKNLMKMMKHWTIEDDGKLSIISRRQ